MKFGVVVLSVVALVGSSLEDQVDVKTQNAFGYVTKVDKPLVKKNPKVLRQFATITKDLNIKNL